MSEIEEKSPPLEAHARALVEAIEQGRSPEVLFNALIGLIGSASRTKGQPSRGPRPAAPPVDWSVARDDALRSAAESVYRQNASLETRVRELHALVAPFVLAGDMPGLAWEFKHAWGDVATSLMRPLWELAHGP